jgi:hypothetical protein
MGRDFLERNGVVLADAAPADDLAVGVGEGDGVLAAAVPDVAGAAERRQCEDEQADGEDEAEGRGVVGQVEHQAREAPHPEVLQPRTVGGPAPPQGGADFVDAVIGPRIEPPEQARYRSLEASARTRWYTIGQNLTRRHYIGNTAKPHAAGTDRPDSMPDAE